jgi:hypothetical protein
VTIFFPDLSNNNWGSEELTDDGQAKQLTFLNQIRSLGLSGLTHKMSEGSGYVDPYGRIAQKYCKENRLPFLGYHFATTDPPAAQVNNWLCAGGGNSVEIDFEGLDENGNPNLNMVQFWDLVYAFNDAGINVALAYLPQWYADDIGADLSAFPSSDIPLHSSAYPMGYSVGPPSDVYRGCDGDAGEGWAPYCGGPPPSVWQFTSTASIAGINVDCNAYHGLSTNLVQLFTGVTL